MAKDLAIVLNNGSVNSAVVTAMAAQKHRVILLHVEAVPVPGSGSRAAYDSQVVHFKPYREHSLTVPYLGQFDDDLRQTAPADPRRPASSLGPILLDLTGLIAPAIHYAAHYNAAAIYMGLRVGSQGEELARATEFIQVWNELIQMPCDTPDLELTMPLLEMEPWQVVDLGFQVGAPFDKTWSCVEESGESCWACTGCRAREAAFQQAGKPDPLKVVRKV